MFMPPESNADRPPVVMTMDAYLVLVIMSVGASLGQRSLARFLASRQILNERSLLADMLVADCTPRQRGMIFKGICQAYPLTIQFKRDHA
jgi:hypothetical protein